MIKPSRLRKGDVVGIVAPAGVVDSALLEKGLKRLRALGLNPLLGEHVLSRHRYFAGTDEQRAGDLIAMFKNPEVKGIFCARGGYGGNRLLPWLKPKLIRDHPKIFVGASDLTLLLLYINQKCSLVTFHGPMVAGNFAQYPMARSKKQLLDLLTKKNAAKTLKFPRARVLNPGRAEGPVTGGCLTLLCRSLKTPFEIQTRDKILILEDVNEPWYRLDGMLWQLKEAGKFKEVRGIVLGEMVNCPGGGGANGSLDDLYREVFADVPVPIVSHFPIGHGREMWTLPFGVEATLQAGARTLKFSHCGVV